MGGYVRRRCYHLRPDELTQNGIARAITLHHTRRHYQDLVSSRQYIQLMCDKNDSTATRFDMLNRSRQCFLTSRVEVGVWFIQHH